MSTDSADNNRYLHLIRQDCPLPPGTHIVGCCYHQRVNFALI